MTQKVRRSQRRAKQIAMHGECTHTCACGCKQQCARHNGHGKPHQYVTPTGLRIVCAKREGRG